MGAEGNEKIIDKLRKIMAHSESAAKIGNEAEAQAFAEMFNKLLLRHKLEMTDVEWNRMEAEEPVEEHYVDYRKHDKKFKASRVRVAWSERLGDIIARAHFCQIVVMSASNRLKLVGRRTDVQMAEYMLVTMQRLVETMSLREAHAHRLSCRRSGAYYAPKFRASWIQGFVMRLAERYEEARRSQEGSSTTALVRLPKAARDVAKYIDDKMDEEDGFKKAAIVRGSRGHSAAGYQRGREAADQINLKPNVVGGGPSGQKEIK